MKAKFFEIDDLIMPAKAHDELPKEFTENHVAEDKIDGSRYMLYLGDGIDPYGRQPSHTLLSKRISTTDGKHVDRTRQVPHITDQLYRLELSGTVLDGEIFKDDFGTTVSIISSSPAQAVQKQISDGYLTFHAFDIPFFRGKDIRGLPYSQRRKVLLEVCNRLSNPHIVPVNQYTEDFEEKFREITSAGGEGLIIKDKRMAYGLSWSKMKKVYDLSAVITGFKAGKGANAGQVGSFLISVLHLGKMIEIGCCSGFDSAVRKDATANPDKYLGRVIDVNAMRINKPSPGNPLGRLFQPTFFRFRDDVNADDVTFEKLNRDLRNKPKSKRRFRE